MTACGEKGANGQPSLDVPNNQQPTAVQSGNPSSSASGAARTQSANPTTSATGSSQPSGTTATSTDSSSTASTSGTATTASTTAPPEPPKPTVPTALPTTLATIPGVRTQTGKLGSATEFSFVGSRGKVTILKTEWERDANHSGAKQPKSGNYLLLRVRLDGVSGTTLSSPLYFTAVDADGKKQTADPLTGGYQPSLYGKGLKAGDSKTGYVAIDTKKGPTTVTFGAGGLVNLVQWNVK